MDANGKAHYLCVVEWYDDEQRTHQRVMTYYAESADEAATRAMGSTVFSELTHVLNRVLVYELAGTPTATEIRARRAPQWVPA